MTIDGTRGDLGVRVGDLDSDGNNDVAVGKIESQSKESPIHWYENLDGDGRAWKLHVIQLDAATGSMRGIADFNLDGAPDLLVGLDGDLAWLRQGASVQEWSRTNIMRGGVGPALIFRADPDRAPDIVVSTPDALIFHRNRIPWDGSWQSEIVDNMVWTELRGPAIAVGDIDGDNRPDIVASGLIRELGTRSQLAWYQSETRGIALGDRGLGWKRTIIDSARFTSTYLSVADLDNDGDNDIIETSHETVQFSPQHFWYENIEGDGQQWERHRILTDLDRAIVLVDIDGNESVDLVGYRSIATQGGSRFEQYWLDNDLTSELSAWRERIIPGQKSILVPSRFGDVDGDGRIDQVLPSTNENSRIIFNSDCSEPTTTPWRTGANDDSSTHSKRTRISPPPAD